MLDYRSVTVAFTRDPKKLASGFVTARSLCWTESLSPGVGLVTGRSKIVDSVDEERKEIPQKKTNANYLNCFRHFVGRFP